MKEYRHYHKFTRFQLRKFAKLKMRLILIVKKEVAIIHPHVPGRCSSSGQSSHQRVTLPVVYPPHRRYGNTGQSNSNCSTPESDERQ